jgi:myo-inositol-1(or 4)-monophosphatase
MTILLPDGARDILAEVRALTVGVGDELARRADELRTATAKPGVDVVTAADHLSEELLVTALAKRFPTHRVAGEEGTVRGPADSPWTWHIDPLDGTGNFSRGLPAWGISVGLAHGHEPVLGVLHLPLLGHTLTGLAGIGAWNGDDALPQATPPGDPRTWMLATDWPWALSERQRTVRLLERLASTIRQYKSWGSAAVDFAHTALGRVDGYVISHIFPWDQCGGAAILRALDYDLRRWNGDRWDLRHADIAALRPGMWDIIGPACA